jgi:predicted nucleic acid-binding protein
VWASALQVVIPGELRVCRDPQDDKFLKTAIAGNVNFLEIKNLKHFPAKSFQNVCIVKISTILSVLEKLYHE